jgi:small subunit ribosomal protein S7e
MSQLKCVKPAGLQPSAKDSVVIKAFLEIQKHDDLKAELEPLYFIAAKEIKVPGGKQAIVIFVPFRQLTQYRKVQARLVREFEKKFSGKHVVIIAQRKVIRKFTKTNRKAHQKVPRSRTVTAVNEAILNDLVYPTEIVAQRLRVRLDASRLLKVFLNRNDQSTVEYKLDTFAHVYNKLTGRNVQFLFPHKEEVKNYSFRKKKTPSRTSFGLAVKAAYQAPAEGTKKAAVVKKLSASASLKKKLSLAKKKIVQQKRNQHTNEVRGAARRKEAGKRREAQKIVDKREREEAKKNGGKKAGKAAKGAKAAKVAEPVKVAEPTKPAKGAKAAKVAKTAEPAKTAKVAEPTKPAKAAKAAKVAKVAEPTKQAKVAKTAKVAEVKKAEPVKAAKTASAPKAAKAAKPKK